MSHGIDADYTATINFLALYGYDELMKSGFDETLLRRFDSKAASDETTVKVITSDWLSGTMPGFQSKGAKTRAESIHESSGRTSQSPAAAVSKLKTVSARCIKCKEIRQMKDAHIETMKNGRRVIRGICPTCGSKMVHFGIPG